MFGCSAPLRFARRSGFSDAEVTEDAGLSAEVALPSLGIRSRLKFALPSLCLSVGVSEGTSGGLIGGRGGGVAPSKIFIGII